MPIFVLVCESCGYKMEFMKLRSDDENPRVCPECNGPLDKGVTNTSYSKLKTPPYGVL